MVRALLLAGLAVGLVAVPGGVAGQPAAEEGRAILSAEKIIDVLHNQRASYEKDLQTTPLPEVLADLAKRYDIRFVVNKAAFGDFNISDSKAENLLATSLNGVSLHRLLTIYLSALPLPQDVVAATYLVHDDCIEITSREAAQKEAGLWKAIQKTRTSDDPNAVFRGLARMNQPLVCVAVKDKPLGAVLKDLSRVYGLNVVVDREARQMLDTQLTERLLNVPADTALEMLAGQAGLSVVRKGNVFRIIVPAGM